MPRPVAPALLATLVTVLVTCGLAAPSQADDSTPVAAWSPSAARASVAARTRTPPKPADGHILMLDTATTPSLASIRAWQASSPYQAIGVYIPITSKYDVRYDKTQALLNPAWIHAVRSGGWHVLPIYVGLQASCSTFSKRLSSNTRTARAQGASMAADAANSVYRLGIPVSSPIVFDLEAYPTGNKKCTASAQAMQAGWTQRLHQLGRNSGLYGSLNSTIADATAAAMHPTYAKPDVLWVARYNGEADTTFDLPPANMWAGHRLHQFTGGGVEQYGGVAINIDESAVQASVFHLPPPDRKAPVLARPVRTITHAAQVDLSWYSHDQSGIASYQVQVLAGRTWTSPAALANTTATHQSFPVAAGSKTCVRFHATDKVGNRSDWRRVCGYRWGNGSRFHGGSWTTSGTDLITHRRGAIASGPTVTTSKVGIQLRGSGPVAVILGHRVIGTVRGIGTHWISLKKPAHGRLSVRSLSKLHVTLRGYIALP